MSETVLIETSVDIAIYDVCWNGFDLEFKADVDGDGDIRIEVTTECDELLSMIGYDKIISYLESEYPKYKESSHE